MSKLTRRPYHNVKVRDAGFARLNKLVATLSQHGWAAAGIVRPDRVSSLNVLDAALVVLELRLKERR